MISLRKWAKSYVLLCSAYDDMNKRVKSYDLLCWYHLRTQTYDTLWNWPCPYFKMLKTMYLVLSEKLSSNLRYRIYLIDYFSYFKMLKTMNCFQRNLLNRSKITLKFIFCEKIEVWKYGSIKSSFLLDPKTSCGVMDPENHQGSITPHEVLGPPKHMRFWEGKTLKTLIRVHQTTWSFGSIKTHEVLKGSIKSHELVKMRKIWLGPSTHMKLSLFHCNPTYEKGSTP